MNISEKLNERIVENDGLQEWEKEIIKKAFNNYISLQGVMKSAKEKNDDKLMEIALETLNKYSGMQISFLKKHLDEIINLKI